MNSEENKNTITEDTVDIKDNDKNLEATVTAAKKGDRTSRGTKAAVAVVCAASIICVPFFAASGANVSEQAKVAEADMQVEKTLVAEAEPSVEEAPIEVTELSNSLTAQELADKIVVNTVGVSYTEKTPAVPEEEPAEEPAEEEDKDKEEEKEEKKVNEDDASENTKEDEPLKEYALGDRHTYVAKIQARLMELNYMEDDSPTNYFGPLTSQAISYFQRKNGLSMTGVADQKTLKVLFSSDAKVYSATQGARGDDIKLIQERLNELGYTCKADGYLGAKTKAAIMAFQENNGLTVDGTVGSHTREVLFSSSAKKATKKTTTDQKTEEKKTEEKATEQKTDNQSTDNKSDDKKQEEKKEETPKSNELQGDNSNAPSPNSSKVEALISAAEALLGKPYVYGGKGPDEFDCSGFVYYALNQSGFKISYMTSGGWANSGYATIYGMDNLKRGDIVCFKGHVGICLGGDDMIDASTAKGQIRKFYGISGNKYWQEHFICGKRPLV